MPLFVANRSRLEPGLSVIGLVCTLGALVLLGTVVSWPLQAAARDWVRLATFALVVLFVLGEALRVVVEHDPRAYLRRHRLEVTLAVIATLELGFGPAVLGWLAGHFAPEVAGSLMLAYLAAIQLTVLGVAAVRLLRRTRLLATRRLTPGMVLMISFATLIVLGTLLLKSPHATTVGIAWIDAAFTATSAVCVTGLITVDTATAFTTHGQWVILILFQLGGLGLMTLTYFFAFFFAGGVTIRNRIALQDLLSEENLAQVGTVLAVVVGFTLGIEAVGAALIYLSLDPVWGGAGDRAFLAVFHAVSAFCNAGFSLLSDGLADPRVVGNTTLITVIMVLIVAGGLGFPVWKNLWLVTRARLGRASGHDGAAGRLTANSRIVLVTTAGLLLGGALLIYLTEFIAADGLAADGTPLTALFHAVTARTAGFNLTPTDSLAPATAAVIMFLMFVGGSPSSTAGGIKTTTLAVAGLALRRVVLGRTEIEAFGRRLGDEIVNRALAVMLVAIAFITLVTVALLALHPELPPADLTFEAVSAVSTVGLSRGVTAHLGPPAKLVLMLAMFVGRVGVLACLLALVPRREPTGYRLPEANVVIT
jgi:trk system potassium uptake protein